MEISGLFQKSIIEGKTVKKAVDDIPKGWKPPPKTLGGESMPRIFAIMLMDFALTKLITSKFQQMKPGEIEPAPLIHEFAPYKKECEAVLTRLEERGIQRSSISHDFDLMRNISFSQPRSKPSQEVPINSISDMYQFAVREVRKWWDLPVMK
jgi:hypothetical protein